MEQPSVNQRVKFLIEHMGLSARAFSEAIDESPTNTHNYIGKRNSMPGADYIEKILNRFDNVNPIWLITGRGEPFTGETPTAPVNINNRKNKAPVQNNTGSHATITNNVQLDNCQRDLEATKKEAAAYQREIALLQGQLKDKEEIITLLRASYNRPN